jgi:putative spermidine/putrescine transport system substrate-binding protein
LVLCALVLAFSMIGCAGGDQPQQQGAADKPASEVNLSDFDSVSEAARGTTVNFYLWGGSDRTNGWVDNQLATYVKENYDITLNRVPVDDTQVIIAKMLDEKQAGVTDGSVDMLWVNGENFYTSKENDLLYGPFLDVLPNYRDYIDTSSELNNFDFGVSVDGLEAPFGKAVFVFINDSAVTPETPKNAQELMEFAQKYPGQITYPAPPDFTGSVFVRQIIYDVVGYDVVKAAGNDKEKIRAAIKPAIDYLNELKPYLWSEGTTYPATQAQVTSMFADGELVLDVSYDPNSVSSMIYDGAFPETARDFVFEKGMIGNVSFLAIPKNASNTAGALAVINGILSPEMQATKADPNNWGATSVLDYDKLDADGKRLFDSIPLGPGAIPESELSSILLPELPASMVPLIEEIWLEDVARQ